MPFETANRRIDSLMNLKSVFPSVSRAKMINFMGRIGSNVEKNFELPYKVSPFSDGIGLYLFVLTSNEAKSVGFELPSDYVKLNKELDYLGSVILSFPQKEDESKWYEYKNDLELLGYAKGKRREKIAHSTPEFMDEVLEIIADVRTSEHDDTEKYKQLSAFKESNALVSWVGMRSLEERDDVTRKAYKLAEKVKKQRERLLVTIY